MALLKNMEINDTGSFAEYWKVVRFSFDALTGKTVAEVGGYVNQAARQGGKKPATFMNLRFQNSNIQSIASVYEHLKALAKFANATDI